MDHQNTEVHGEDQEDEVLVMQHVGEGTEVEVHPEEPSEDEEDRIGVNLISEANQMAGVEGSEEHEEIVVQVEEHPVVTMLHHHHKEDLQ